MRIKGIIFDLDGTLTDTLGLYMQGFRQAVEPLTGKHYTDEEITATLGPSEEGIIQALLPDSHEQALTAYLSAYSRLLASCRGLYQDVEALLAELRAGGMLLGLVTGKGPGSTALTLAHYGLTDFFSEIATGSPEGAFKALRIEEIRTRWGLTAQEVLYVGDAPSDIQAAKAAGVNMAVAAWSPQADAAALALLHPDAVMTSISDFRRWLRQHETVRLVTLAQQVQALAQTGLTFTKDPYDIERYTLLRDIAAQLMAIHVAPDSQSWLTLFQGQQGYATPKVDVRGIVLRDGKLLLARERDDKLWSLPGGWADVGDRPSEAIRRELQEETGLAVKVNRLLGVWDRNLHGHPPYPFHVYKMIFLCEECGGELGVQHDSLEVDFFDPRHLPPLSLTRIMPVEIQTCLTLAARQGPAYFD